MPTLRILSRPFSDPLGGRSKLVGVCFCFVEPPLVRVPTELRGATELVVGLNLVWAIRGWVSRILGNKGSEGRQPQPAFTA